MGFWDHAARGIGTPSASWMAELLTAQQAGGDLDPHISSRQAAELPKQFAPLLRAETRNLLEARRVARLCTPLPVAGDPRRLEQVVLEVQHSQRRKVVQVGLEVIAEIFNTIEVPR